jgi:NADPH:quinone reductase-like Zn-dependent oxidoreductase
VRRAAHGAGEPWTVAGARACSGVGSTELTVIAGNYSFAPKMPFVPGYEIAGTIDAIGPGVIGFQIDQRFAALRTFARGERLDVILTRGSGGFQRLYHRFDWSLHLWPMAQTAADVGGTRGGELIPRAPEFVR